MQAIMERYLSQPQGANSGQPEREGGASASRPVMGAASVPPTSVNDIFIHPTADVSSAAQIGAGTRVWNLAQIREGARIGAECIISKNVYIDFGVQIGSRVKIQNNVSVYHGVTVEDGVLIGPHVCFCNDMLPRAITPDGALKSQDDWQVGRVLVCTGASIGAGSIILPDVTIGAFALIGAGSVVTRSVAEQALVFGNPARLHGYVCRCARKLEELNQTPQGLTGICPVCQITYTLPAGELEEDH
jgi:acetyltransferase-like isoleucine patch superfamily enzyme